MKIDETFIAKYKPYHVDEFRFDESLRDAIKTMIELDDLNILFIGGPSTGKTTLLNALIRDYYNLKKRERFPENNILVINNLKEQGIQYFRTEMKTFCQSRSAIHGKKKLVIIDDIDIINEQSQQVFRNYIDKYKNNIHLISVCTNIQKVIESIQSRTHLFKLPMCKDEEINLIMEKIITTENIKIDTDSKKYLLSVCGSSIRLIITYLEKLHILNQVVDVELCKLVCSNISNYKYEEYITCLKKKDLVGGIKILYDIYDYGYSVIDILDYFFTFVKQTKILNEDEKYKIIPVLCKYITIFHNVHEDCIELALFTNKLLPILTEV
jgi:DNA polymerase-3 subunit gamma/tau